MAQAQAEQTGYAAPPKNATAPSGGTSTTDTLSSGDASKGVLNQYGRLVSANSKYEVEMRGDGDLVIVTTANRQPIWSSGTSGSGTSPYTLVMQADANLVIYGANGFVWNSGSCCVGKAPYKLVMQNDGNLCIYDANGAFIWESHTAR
jgi:hypothetical protein